MMRPFSPASGLGRLLLVLTVFAGSAVPFTSFAEDETKSSEIDFPLVVVNVASFQRLRDNAGLMFESADRLDMLQHVDNWTVNFLKETKGIDRSRPFGLMFYLPPGFFGAPNGISYLPVTNLEEALETLAYGTGTITLVEGKQNQHEIRYGESFRLRTLYHDRYLFLVGPDGDESALDRNFPPPEKLTARLSSQYDVAVSLMLKSVPPALKTVFLEYFKNQSRADLQQRDDEPESVYRLRRANGEGWLELVDKVITQGEEFTIGGRIDGEQKHGMIDVEVAGTSDSKLAKFFQNMAGKRTYFGNLLDIPSTFTMSASWLLEEKQRKLFVTFFEAAQRDLGANIDQEGTAGFAKIIDPLFKTLMTSADVGHIDLFARLTGTEQEEFVLIAGTKLATSRNLPSQITELLRFVKDNPDGSELASKLELDVDAIDSHPVHRLPVNPPDKAGQRLFGEASHLYIYASNQAIWCAFGGEPALESLKQAVEAAGLPQDPKQGRNRVPFQFVTHAKNWLTVADTDNPDPAGMAERAHASFESDNDAMRIEIRPTDSGLRVRTEFESGFIALLGRSISNGIESGSFLFKPPGRNRGRGRNQADEDVELPRSNN